MNFKRAENMHSRYSLRKASAVHPFANLFLICLGFLPGWSFAVEPLIHAHAHNDYEHTHPLKDALAAGFCSIEADVYLVNGQLLVGHEHSQTRPDRTLQSLYLDPLHRRVQGRGPVFSKGDGFTLLIDFKTGADETYRALRPVLEHYRDMLTRFTDANKTPGAVTVILSGSRPIEQVRSEPERLCAIDGRLPDLDANPSPGLVPWVSDNWTHFFTWDGKGKIPADQRDRLRKWTARAHAQGRRIRFWATPDNPRAWSELLADGVDLINTDHLTGLRDFFLTREKTVMNHNAKGSIR